MRIVTSRGCLSAFLAREHPFNPAVGHELRRLGMLLPKDVTLVVGGAASTGYRPLLEEIDAAPVGDLAGFRSQLRGLRRGRKLTR